MVPSLWDQYEQVRRTRKCMGKIHASQLNCLYEFFNMVVISDKMSEFGKIKTSPTRPRYYSYELVYSNIYALRVIKSGHLFLEK